MTTTEKTVLSRHPLAGDPAVNDGAPVGLVARLLRPLQKTLDAAPADHLLHLESEAERDTRALAVPAPPATVEAVQAAPA